MKNKSILALIVAGMISLGACSANSVPVSPSDTAVSETTVSATETTATTTEAAPENYVHGEDGYYCIVDELPDFQLRQQEGGTCWLFSAAAGMESSYAKKSGKYISIDPMELLDIVYDDEKAEGFFLDKGMSKKRLRRRFVDSDSEIRKRLLRFKRRCDRQLDRH